MTNCAPVVGLLDLPIILYQFKWETDILHLVTEVAAARKICLCGRVLKPYFALNRIG